MGPSEGEGEGEVAQEGGRGRRQGDAGAGVVLPARRPLRLGPRAGHVALPGGAAAPLRPRLLDRQLVRTRAACRRASLCALRVWEGSQSGMPGLWRVKRPCQVPSKIKYSNRSRPQEDSADQIFRTLLSENDLVETLLAATRDA